MSIFLPSGPRMLNAQFIPIDASSDLTSPLGGPTMRLNRLGDKTALLIQFPDMKHQACGHTWSSKIKQARKVGAICYIPKFLLMNPTQAGEGIKVDGTDSAGQVLKLKGFPANFPLKDDHPISIIHAGVRYVHFIYGDTTAGSDGKVTLTVSPMLRTPLSNNDTVEVDNPAIEGLIPKESPGPMVSQNRKSKFGDLTISENR